MIPQFIGVYWVASKNELPEDWTLCIFHIKWRSANGIYSGLLFGKYYNGNFYEKDTGKIWKASKIDYWMPIPVLPERRNNVSQIHRTA